MKCAVYASSKSLGKTGINEIKNKHIEGKLFAKNSGFTSLLYSDQVGADSISGWHNMCLAMDAGGVHAVWIKALNEFGDESADLTTILYILRERRLRLYVDGSEQNVASLAFRKETAKLFGIPVSELDFLLTSQHLGRLRHIDNGNRIAPNVFGYIYTRKIAASITVKIHPREARVVSEIYSLYGQGYSLQRIADSISNAETKMAGKVIGGRVVIGKFTRFQIMKILRRPEYCGMTFNHDHSELIPSLFPPIQDITVAFWKSIQNRLDLKARPHKIPIDRNIFSGLITCLHCGAPYYARESGSLFHKNPKCNPLKSVENRNHNLRVDIIRDYLTILLLSKSPIGDLLSEYLSTYQKTLFRFSNNLENGFRADETISKAMQSLKIHLEKNIYPESITRLKSLITKKSRTKRIAFKQVSKITKVYKEGAIIKIPDRDFSVKHIARLSDDDRLALIKHVFSSVQIDNNELIVKTNTGRSYRIDMKCKSGDFISRYKIYKMICKSLVV